MPIGMAGQASQATGKGTISHERYKVNIYFLKIVNLQLYSGTLCLKLHEVPL
jgi:hypothetical protein